MERINTASKAVDMFGAGKHGYTGGNPSTNTAATQMSPAAMNALQEEVCNVIESTGVALNPLSRTQLRAAISAIIAAEAGVSITADWVLNQLSGAGKNPDGLRVRRYLGSGVDPYSIVEDTDADFDTAGSANIPAGYVGYARLVVSRHRVTSIPAVPNGGYIFAEYKFHSLYDHREWKSICTTDSLSGTKVYSSWEQVGGGTEGSAKAWIVLDQTTGAVRHSFNISTAVVVSAGVGRVTFATPASDVHYGITGGAFMAQQPWSAYSFPTANKLTTGCDFTFIAMPSGIPTSFSDVLVEFFWN
ncbi:MAG: hypothetical protein PHP85_14505 [Gallionella sp.]|nr:hypothetical protein [Gallionella sp.]